MARLIIKIDDPDFTKICEEIWNDHGEAVIGEDGKEYPNPEVLAEELGERSPTLKEQIQRIMYHEQFKRTARMAGYESPEEFNDFNVNDEPEEPLSGYELTEMEEEIISNQEPNTGANEVKAEEVTEKTGDTGETSNVSPEEPV